MSYNYPIPSRIHRIAEVILTRSRRTRQKDPRRVCCVPWALANSGPLAACGPLA